MTLVRFRPASLSPARDLMSIHDEMNRWFDGFTRGTSSGRTGGAAFVPAVDIEETAEGFVLSVDLPGVDPKDVQVSVLGDTLTIRGTRVSEASKAEKNLHRSERVHGSFERRFRLGIPVRNDGVKASYQNGVLEIHVPKAEEARPREIEIQVAQ